MVSGLVTSPLDHERICFEEARPMLMASKLLMSITVVSAPGNQRKGGEQGWRVGQLASWRPGPWRTCQLANLPTSRRSRDSFLTFSLDVLLFLLLSRLIGLPPFALRLDRVLGLVGGFG